MWTAQLTENDASFSSNTSPTSPTAQISSIVNVRGVILFPTKKAHHTWLTKLRNNALACLRWLWPRRPVVSRPPPHYRDTEGLLHNLRPGCFTSVIKGIRLGRPDPFLAISYTAEHKDPGSESLCMKHTHYKLSWLLQRADNQCMSQGTKPFQHNSYPMSNPEKKREKWASLFSLSVEL